MLRRVQFDEVIFHTTFLSMRWAPQAFADLVERAKPLKRLGLVRIAIPQDEFLHTSALSDFINDFDVGHVFTAAAESEWPKIYAGVDRSRVGFTTVLTGYLEDDSVARMAQIAAQTHDRTIDIGYRAWHAAPWLGRHGLLKTEIADAFARRGAEHGLRLDISTRDQETLYGDDWYRFLATSKYTIGVEGGASVLDADGSIKAATERYLAAHPDVKFDEIEAECFPNQDGGLALFAISPRHLEACATRTCQILVEGSYNGVLRPGEHYIELRRDLSNLDEIIDMVKSDELRDSITDRAWRDIVASGRYSYRGFVEEVQRVVASAGTRSPSQPRMARTYIAVLDRLTWIELALRVGYSQRAWARLAALLKAVLPDFVVAAIRRRLAPR